MLGTRGAQRGRFEADTLYAEFMGRDTCYGGLAGQRGELFPDELFLGLYLDGWGRPSVPPSLLATALVLQTYDGVSDEEATRRAAYDLHSPMEGGVGHRSGHQAVRQAHGAGVPRPARDSRGAAPVVPAAPGVGEAAGHVGQAAPVVGGGSSDGQRWPRQHEGQSRRRCNWCG